MNTEQAERLTRLADCICLVFHEARNVRHIKHKIENWAKYKELISLPKNRSEAWKAMSGTRNVAARAVTAVQALDRFQEKYRVSIEELCCLYQEPIWKDSASVGGNKWMSISRKVADLVRVFDLGDSAAFDIQHGELMGMKHNTGVVGDKLKNLNST